MNNSKTAKKLDDVIRTKMEIEENHEILLQQLKQLQELQTSQQQVIGALNEQILGLEDKNNHMSNELSVAYETIQKLRTEKEIEIRKVINIGTHCHSPTYSLT
jgi:hypothetical protein